jgi:hypothetical protein
MSQEKNFKVIFNNCHLEMSKKCWPRFRVRNIEKETNNNQLGIQKKKNREAIVLS